MTTTIAWVLLFDAAFQLCYSLVNIPYGSLSAAMTQDPVDRSRLSGARAIANALAGVALSAIIAPQFEDTTADGIRLRFTVICAVLGLVAVALLLVCFARTREVVPRPPDKVSVKEAFLGLGKNRPLLVLCLGAFFLLGALFTMNAVAMYYTTFVLGSAAWFVFLQLAMTVAMILVSSLVPAITRRVGKRNGYVACALIAAVGFVAISLVPGGQLPLAMAAWFVVGIGMGGTNALMFSMQADTVDYGELVTGNRAEGGSYSILSFIRKVGQGVGGWLGGMVIGAFGYVEQQSVQSAEAIDGIRVAAGVVPAVLAVLCAVVAFFYRLDADKHATVVTELHERHTQRFVATSKGVEPEQVRAVDVGDGRSILLRSAEEALPPIVTLFGQRGSGATDVAPKLAERLGVPYIRQVFDYRALAEVDPKDLISDTGVDRWLRTMANSAAMPSGSSTAPTSNRDIARENSQAVLRAVADGGVILGRNATVVLGSVVGVLHVRLVAPLGKRIERVMAQTGLPASEAAQQCAAEDRIRAEMALNLYGWDPREDEHYDLVLNTGTVTYDQVAEFIATLYYSKYSQATRPGKLR